MKAKLVNSLEDLKKLERLYSVDPQYTIIWEDDHTIAIYRGQKVYRRVRVR